VANADVSFEHDRFDNLPQGTYEGRLTFRGRDGTSTSSGFTVSGSHFSGGCSDGVQLIGDVTSATIGPGNEFTNIVQGNCAPVHADPIQFYGASATLVTGNYFHDNGDGSGGIMSPDGDDGYTVTNNVFDQTGVYPWAVDVEGCSGCTVTHNVVRNADVFAGVSNGGSPTTNLVVRDNVFLNGGVGSEGSATYSATYNLNCGCTGTGNITGTPVFLSSPSSGYYHWQLDAASPGYHAASDGTSMGIAP